MISSQKKTPAHEQVYMRIRDMILYGDFTPGQAVTIQGLVDEIGVSMTPVREAIRRLTAEGALDFMGNRRVCVPQTTEARFAELAYARLAIEPKLAEMAAKVAQESDIQCLRDIDNALNRAINTGDTKAYMLENHRFHFTLYCLSGSDILLPIARTLWLRYGPLYRIISGKYGTSNLIDQHDEAILGLQANDPVAVSNAIRNDIEQGFEIIRKDFSSA